MSGEVGGEGATAASPVCSMCLFHWQTGHVFTVAVMQNTC